MEVQNPKITMDNAIKGFYGYWRFLSNFYPCNIETSYGIFPSAENYYQAFKYLHMYNWDTPVDFFLGCTPAESKKKVNSIRRNIPSVEDRLNYMKIVLDAKFTQNEDLARKLLDTDPLYLEEKNTWGDRFWGTCSGSGYNMLGLFLMRQREELRQLWT